MAVGHDYYKKAPMKMNISHGGVCIFMLGVLLSCDPAAYVRPVAHASYLFRAGGVNFGYGKIDPFRDLNEWKDAMHVEKPGELVMQNGLPDLFDAQPDLPFQLVRMPNPSALQEHNVLVYSVLQILPWRFHDTDICALMRTSVEYNRKCFIDVVVKIHLNKVVKEDLSEWKDAMQVMQNSPCDILDAQPVMLFQLVTMLNPSVLQEHNLLVAAAGLLLLFVSSFDDNAVAEFTAGVGFCVNFLKEMQNILPGLFDAQPDLLSWSQCL
ncbi:hypothetical protein L6452_12205 [Arctium lappa]|uniref:Uncharacterized protein n=1 Tax=Arctium lappa TaxID=4217 RepID=A0ACB9DRA9_ARCLA|nr:hypothetical protein L6452_12205 [Arctium lappa]